MARIIPNNELIQDLTINPPSNATENLVYIGQKVLRAKIVADRYTRGFQKVDRDGPRDAYEHGGRNLSPDKEHRTTINEERNSGRRRQVSNEDGYISEPLKIQSNQSTLIKEYISIVDLDYIPSNDDASRYYNYIRLPFVPSELSYSPMSKFVGIHTLGRNNPFYQFTGSEDTLVFEIDWFTERLDRKDVSFYCKWVEALSKANGYDDIPHRVKLVWGNNNELYKNDIWLVASAPYRFTNFVRGYRDADGNTVSTDLLPQRAIQTITLKRLTTGNRTTKQIIGNNFTR